MRLKASLSISVSLYDADDGFIAGLSGGLFRAVVLDRRKASETLSIPLDSYRVESVSSVGVKIGCTVVPWPEVDYISAELSKTAV